MQSSQLGLLVLLGCLIAAEAQGTSPSNHYVRFTFGLTWNEASKFCKRNHIDLAAFSTPSDMNSMDLKQYEVWVGLYGWKYWWKWSDGATHRVLDWGNEEPKWGKFCASVSFSDKKIYSRDCGTRLMFVCRIGGTYKFVNETKTWFQAWNHCINQNGNLASFSSSKMNEIFTEFDFPIWIGLKRVRDSFSWTSGGSGYINWRNNEPNRDGDCVAVSSLSRQMSTKPCDVQLPFVCMGHRNVSVQLVKEQKSWEEALEHCRGLSGNGLLFDLVSVQPGDEHQYMMRQVMAADTEEVWTGLRFLGDEWLWVDGAEMTSDLLQCPVQERRCGALSKSNTGAVEHRDCSERKNFLCYSFPA